MTYLEELEQIEQKIDIHVIGLNDCIGELTQLIYTMANKIESLTDDLRRFEEEDWNGGAYGH